jgi:hypothetical protein
MAAQVRRDRLLHRGQRQPALKGRYAVASLKIVRDRLAFFADGRVLPRN